MGHRGMKYSLPSREIIEDTIEVMVEATSSTGWSSSPPATRSSLAI
jgi:dihydroxyacid dehydratase/phosphogluconate dehydratase